MTKQGDDLCKAIAELQPRGGGTSAGLTLQEKVKRLLDDILEKLPEQFSLLELEDRAGVEDRTPFTNVFLQEVDRMSKLLYEMRRSLVELDMGLRGDLSMSEAMETLMDSIYDDTVPARWSALAWPSLRPLASWLLNMLDRYRQLADWTVDMTTPKVRPRAPGDRAQPARARARSARARPLARSRAAAPPRRRARASASGSDARRSRGSRGSSTRRPSSRRSCRSPRARTSGPSTSSRSSPT
jgi:hypothetical protein